MLKIRTARKEDASAIINININSWRETYKEIFPDIFLNSLSENIEESINKCKNNISEYIVATIDDRVVGFCRIGKNKKGYPSNYAEIYALYIDKDYKGQKIGTGLVKYSFSILNDKYDFCLISILKENSANIFYKKINGNFIETCKFNVMDNSYIENIYEFKI